MLKNTKILAPEINRASGVLANWRNQNPKTSLPDYSFCFLILVNICYRHQSSLPISSDDWWSSMLKQSFMIFYTWLLRDNIFFNAIMIRLFMSFHDFSLLTLRYVFQLKSKLTLEKISVIERLTRFKIALANLFDWTDHFF